MRPGSGILEGNRLTNIWREILSYPVVNDRSPEQALPVAPAIS
jgi:hypothetical protein